MFEIDILRVSFKYTSLYINILHQTCLLKSYFIHRVFSSYRNFFYLLRPYKCISWLLIWILIIIQLNGLLFFIIIFFEGFIEIFEKLLYYLIFMIYPFFPIVHFVYIVFHSISEYFVVFLSYSLKNEHLPSKWTIMSE